MGHQLQIKGNRSIKDIQEEFQTVFPDLRINFFHHSHAAGSPSEKADVIGGDELVSAIQSQLAEGTVELDPGMKVAEFEATMQEKYGMGVQVFRRSGKQWIQTTITDHWTLGHQEEEGKESLEFNT